MPNIPCKICGALINDPCVKVSGLFLTKMDLEAQPFPDQTKLDAVNYLVEEELGVNEHQQHFNNFVARRSGQRVAPQPILFRLTCINGHKDHYSITCS